MTRPSSLGSVVVCTLLIGCFLAPPAYAIKGAPKGGPGQILSGLVERGRRAFDGMALRTLSRAESRPAQLGATAQVPWLVKYGGLGLLGFLSATTLKNGFALHQPDMIGIGLFGSAVFFGIVVSGLRKSGKELGKAVETLDEKLSKLK